MSSEKRERTEQMHHTYRKHPPKGHLIAPPKRTVVEQGCILCEDDWAREVWGEWSLDTEGLLLITGIGHMPDCAYEKSPWYQSREQVQIIKLGQKIWSIGEYAFADCCSVKQVILPDSLKIISSYAFQNCSALTNISIPYGVCEIENHAFEGCKKLEMFSVPFSMEKLGTSVFKGCTGLKTIYMSDKFDRPFFKSHYGISKDIVEFF